MKVEQMRSLKQEGFTLLEILIAIAIVMAMAIAVVPNMGRKRPQAERIAFVAQLNSLMQLAWQNALTQNRLHRMVFDFEKKSISAERATGKKDAKGQPAFEPSKITYLDTQIKWPDNLQIKNFFIEGYDEMKRFVGRNTGETWFFIVPDGLTQKVTINMVDTADRSPNGRPKRVGLVLNPFNAQFKVYDTFKK